MFQKQRKAGERADAEDRRRLAVAVWAQGEESCDCHPDGWRATWIPL